MIDLEIKHLVDIVNFIKEIIYRQLSFLLVELVVVSNDEKEVIIFYQNLFCNYYLIYCNYEEIIEIQIVN